MLRFLLLYYLFKNKVTSSFNGIDGTAPSRVTAIAAAFAANSRDRGTSMFSLMHARKYPVKVSPAAVVSTAVTLYAG